MPVLSSNDTLVIIGFSLPGILTILPTDKDPKGIGDAWGATGQLGIKAVRALGCKVRVVESRDGQYGEVYDNGTMTGQYLDLYEGYADISFGSTAREERIDKVIPYTDPFIGERYVGVISGMRHQYTTNPLPYDIAAAQVIGIVFLICVLTSFFALLLNAFDKKYHPKNVQKTAGIITLFVQSFFLEATHLVVRGTKLRLVYGMWLFTMMIFSNYLMGEMRSSSMLQIPTRKLDTVEDCMVDKNCRLLIPDAMYYFLKYEPWCRRVDADNGMTGFDLLMHSEYVEEILDTKAVVISPAPVFILTIRDNYCNQENFPGKFHLGSKGVWELAYIFRYRPGLDPRIVKEFSKRVRWLTETNVPWYQWPDYDISRMKCFANDGSGGTKMLSITESFKFENILPIMLLWAFLLLIATVVCILENVAFYSLKLFVPQHVRRRK